MKTNYQKENYQKQLENIIERNNLEEKIPRLLLHSCCAPCSSYVLEYLSSYFKITVFYYNPNIFPEEEYDRRTEEQKKFIADFSGVSSSLSLNTHKNEEIVFLERPYESMKFEEMVRGLEMVSEGGKRCFLCYEMRLREAAKYAAGHQFDYFTTTLSISPHKNADKLNEIGKKLAEEYGVPYLPSDFKKKDGYRRSIELSEAYGLYRQNYCGCRFSQRTKL